jgi:hypothetical protein
MARRVATPQFLNEEAKHFYQAINEGDDLACILLVSSYLDQCVAALLEKFLIEGETSKKLLDYKSGISNRSPQTWRLILYKPVQKPPVFRRFRATILNKTPCNRWNGGRRAASESDKKPMLVQY